MSTETQFSFLFTGPAVPMQKLSPEDRLPPRSRTKDPASSKRAEAEVKRNGVMRGQRMIALSLVEMYPGSTAEELSRYHALDEVEQFKTKIWLRKRLPELREMKLVRTTQTGNEDLKWWPEGGVE